MLALLLQNNVDGDKIPGKDGVFNLEVEESDIEKAIIILKNQGYPREVFSGIGTVFKQESRIASQLEQQARLNFALTQDLSHTLSQIDGVLAARVHVPIVPPSIGGRDDNNNSQSAAAFIKYDERFDLESLVPHIKGLLSKGLNNVKYSNISVVLVPISPQPLSHPQQNQPNLLTALFSNNDDPNAPSGSTTTLAPMSIITLSLVALLVVSLGFHAVAWRRRKRLTAKDKPTSATATEKAAAPTPAPSAPSA